MPPKLLDIKLELPPCTVDDDVRAVRVVDAGAAERTERFTFVHFYATAVATFIEAHLEKLKCNTHTM